MLAFVKSRFCFPTIFFVLALSAFFSSSVMAQDGVAQESQQELQEESQQESVKNIDPWEGMNRPIFVFNDTLDRWVLKPIATAYRFVLPDFVETGVTNFFSNLLELRNILNDVLQWKWNQAGNDTGRFLVNSTLGFLGLFDVAQHASLEKSEGEDFGQTLGVWGVGDGPFLMLPFLGPSTLRDTAGLPVDAFSDPVDLLDDIPTRNSTFALQFVDKRVGLLEAEALISGDRYLFFREAYMQRRHYLITDGELAAGFGDDFGDDEYGDADF